MDHNLDDIAFDEWAKKAATVTSILQGSYWDDIELVIDTFNDVNNILDEYGFEKIDSLEELREWANA